MRGAAPEASRLTASTCMPNALREPRGLGADLAEADDQQRAVAQLADGLLARRPVALALVGEQRRQVLGEREQPEQRELRQRPGVHAASTSSPTTVELAGRRARSASPSCWPAPALRACTQRERGRAADERRRGPRPSRPGCRTPPPRARSGSSQRGSSSATPPSPRRPRSSAPREQLGQVGQLDPSSCPRSAGRARASGWRSGPPRRAYPLGTRIPRPPARAAAAMLGGPDRSSSERTPVER